VIIRDLPAFQHLWWPPVQTAQRPAPDAGDETGDSGPFAGAV